MTLFIECWLIILDFLRVSDLMTLRRTNKWFKELVECNLTDPLWEKLIRFSQGGHGYCTQTCHKLHRIRFSEKAISGRDTTCPTVLGEFAKRWTRYVTSIYCIQQLVCTAEEIPIRLILPSFHLWQYIRMRHLLHVIEYERPKARSITDKTKMITSAVIQLENLEAAQGIKRAGRWKTIAGDMDRMNLALKREADHIDTDANELREHILLLQSSDDRGLYLSKQ